MILDIFEFQQSYNKEYEGACGKNCLLQILEYYGVKNSPFFINSTLSLTLKKSNDSSLNYDISIGKGSVLPQYSNKIKYHKNKNDTLKVWEENKRKLKQGIPLIIGVDIYYLSYTPHYNRYHNNHNVILCGFSDEDKYATIIDNYQWIYKGNIDSYNFFKARTSTCPKDKSPFSGKSIDNNWIEVESNGWCANPDELFYTTISMTLEQYYTRKSNYENNIFYGVDALRKIMELIMERSKLKSKENVGFFENLQNHILLIYSRLKLFKYYIEISCALYQIDILNKLKIQLVNEIKEWHILSILIQKEIFSKNGSTYLKIIKRFSEIIKIEENIFETLNLLICII